MSIESLSSVDTTWLRMDDPTNWMVVTILIEFDEVADFDHVRRTLEQRLLKFERFTSRVRSHLGRWRWEREPDFNIAHHIRRLRMDEPGSPHAIADLIGEVLAEPLNMDRPPWQLSFIDHGGRSLIVCRLHHVMADGFALLEVLLALTDEHGCAPDSDSEPPRVAGSAPSALSRAWKLGWRGAAALARLAFLPADPPSPFKGKLGIAKRAAWVEGIPLDAIKEIGKAFGATINDVLLAAVAGSLRRFLMAHGHDPATTIRSVVPVNLRPAGQAKHLGNGFGLVFVPLPVAVDDPSERVRRVHLATTEIKRSPQAIVVLGVLAALGLATPGIEEFVVNLFGRKATAVITNVPGPKEWRYLAGKRIRRIAFWVPPAGRLGLGVSILSYAGEVTVGIAADAALVDNPHELEEAFHTELDALKNAARSAIPSQ